ncbi:hypothetical protein [uncultured Selenomonas sp.]|uniref:hypothetical protein n=1 Tax=uncultured Selenomonas sp. TaxID=159275 RepID=UPI0025D66DDA|nr:hypothetical protein [uncultured Selenomonas sp.]
MKEQKYLFPYHLFPEKSRIVLCGSEKIVEAFVEQIQTDKYVRLAGILDADDRGERPAGAVEKVMTMKQLLKIRYDYILLASMDKRRVNSLRHKLMQQGIPMDKIRWDGAVYTRDDFFKKMYFPMLRTWNDNAMPSKDWLKTYEIKMKRSIYDHVFPYHLFHEHARVMIYGGGDIGRKYYKQAKADRFVNIVGIVDQHPEAITDTDVPIESIDSLVERKDEFDYVLIAIHKNSIFYEVSEYLKSLGIPESKIRWEGTTYYRDEFIHNIYFKMIRLLGADFASSHDMLTRLDEAMRELVYDHLFPYELFRKGERIAIYGAGNVGKKFYRQAKAHDFVNVVAIVDRNAEHIHEPGIPVGRIETLKQFCFDSVLISVTNAEIAEEAKETLLHLGIAESKIKWAGESYWRENFYRNRLFPQLDFINDLKTSKI